MSRKLSQWTVPSSLTALLIVAASTMAQDENQGKKKAGRTDRDTVTAASPNSQRASGVIVKAEALPEKAKARRDDAQPPKGQAATHRLTINTAAVWRDWVRDQVGLDANASPSEIAKRGANSVATKGEPQSAGTVVVVDVGPNTKIETLFRESTDETSKGAKTPAEARAASEDPAADKAKGEPSTRRQKQAEGARVTRFQADDLQPGLFVEVDFLRQDARDVASTLAVIRPVGGSDTPEQPLNGEGNAKGKAKGKGTAKPKKER